MIFDMKVDLFIPCFVDQLYPETAFNMIKVLEHVGCDVKYNTNQTCCGQPAFNAGFWPESKEVAKKFISDFSENNYIVAPAGSCVGFVRNFYGELVANSVQHNDYKRVKKNIYEFTEFLVKVLNIDDVGAKLEGKATYHDACGALRECKIKEEPRRLLSKVRGLQMEEMKDVETCCGFGGTFSVKFEPISTGMAEQKINNALATNADYLISTDMSCLMHLDGMIKKRKENLKVMHIADVLASGWE